MTTFAVNKRLLLLTTLSLFFFSSEPTYAQGKEDKLSVEIKNRLYPKRKKFEITGNFGTILNQSYINSLLLNFSATYYTSESLGFGADFTLSMNTNKDERTCVENFYNDPNEDIGPVCQAQGDKAQAQADIESSQGERIALMGPTYPPIRELGYLISGFASWAPIYGKQLFFMSGVVHFDLIFTGGLGVALSDYYPARETAPNGKNYRGSYPAEGEPNTEENTPGVNPSAVDQYGEDARPEPESQTTPLLTVGVGQKFHITKNLNVRVEFKNYTLVGTESGFEPYFAVWGGIGLRF